MATNKAEGSDSAKSARLSFCEYIVKGGKFEPEKGTFHCCRYFYQALSNSFVPQTVIISTPHMLVVSFSDL